MERMKTYRLVADTPHGQCCIDVVLRGLPDAIEAASGPVRKFLDYDCGFDGSWVDEGSDDRTTVTFAVAPSSPPNPALAFAQETFAAARQDMRQA